MMLKIDKKFDKKNENMKEDTSNLRIKRIIKKRNEKKTRGK